MRLSVASAALLLFGSVSDVSAYYRYRKNDRDDTMFYRVTTTVTNPAPMGGTCMSPTWFGIHDGTFDLYDRGQPASEPLERIAEDGTVAPLMEAFASASSTFVDGVVNTGPLCPGETATVSTIVPVRKGMKYFFSYASMILPSNDAFVANGNPRAHEIFNANGDFIPAMILETGGDVLDAGTEVNDEIPANTAFFGQMSPDTGVEENGVVGPHPGFLPPGSGGILDSDQFANADFTADGYEVLSIEVTATELVSRTARVVVTNPAPEGGTCMSPTWVGIHDGSFDIYDGGEPASPGLERLAEDGTTATISDEFSAIGEGAVYQNVVNPGPLCPGEYAFMNFEVFVEPGQKLYFSYASMVLPSNDAFVANGNPKANLVFDADGDLVEVLVEETGSDVLDAGTEVNDELPENTAFFGQMAPDTGVDENGVVGPHPGFLPVGSGGILDDPMFANADFATDDFEMLEIVVMNIPRNSRRGRGRGNFRSSPSSRSSRSGRGRGRNDSSESSDY